MRTMTVWEVMENASRGGKILVALIVIFLLYCIIEHFSGKK